MWLWSSKSLRRNVSNGYQRVLWWVTPPTHPMMGDGGCCCVKIGASDSLEQFVEVSAKRWRWYRRSGKGANQCCGGRSTTVYIQYQNTDCIGPEKLLRCAVWHLTGEQILIGFCSQERYFVVPRLGNILFWLVVVCRTAPTGTKLFSSTTLRFPTASLTFIKPTTNNLNQTAAIHQSDISFSDCGTSYQNHLYI